MLGAPWVGIRWYRVFFSNPLAFRLLRNTFLLGAYSILWGFPATVLIALLFNELHNLKFKKVAQTISYLPYFISVVIIVGMLKEMASAEGIFNQIRNLLGLEPVIYFARARHFRTLYIASGIWQNLGWGAIIYLAAIAGIDVCLYDQALIDGANRLQRVIHITIPSIMPTITIMFILTMGGIMGADFQKVLLMYSPLTYETADIIGTYVYREAFENARFSYSAAVGLLMSVISFCFLYTTNMLARKVSETRLW